METKYDAVAWTPPPKFKSHKDTLAAISDAINVTLTLFSLSGMRFTKPVTDAQVALWATRLYQADISASDIKNAADQAIDTMPEFPSLASFIVLCQTFREARIAAMPVVTPALARVTVVPITQEEREEIKTRFIERLSALSDSFTTLSAAAKSVDDPTHAELVRAQIEGFKAKKGDS